MSTKRFMGFAFVSFCVFLVIFFVKKRHGKQWNEGVSSQIQESVVEQVEEEREQIFVSTPKLKVDFDPTHDPITNEEVDLIDRFFSTGSEQFPIVQTIKYKSRVPWLKGRPAWITDYASFYKTSRHFIARSLNKKKDYFTQKIGFGSTFTVLHPEKEIRFYLVIDISRCKMWFYYHDLGTDEKVLVKTYRVGLGRIDLERESGTLTPLGRYWLADQVASYQVGIKGYFQGKETEMVQVFGTRWIPFSFDIEGKHELKGYGLHGAPWIRDEASGNYVEEQQVIGSYESDGCIRLKQEDIEELYAILITRPTVVEIVTAFEEATLPHISRENRLIQNKGEKDVRT